MSDSSTHHDGTTEPATNGESGPQERSVRGLSSPITRDVVAFDVAYKLVKPDTGYYWVIKVDGLDIRHLPPEPSPVSYRKPPAHRYALTESQRRYRWTKLENFANFRLIDASEPFVLGRSRTRLGIRKEEEILRILGATDVQVSDLRCAPVEVGKWQLHAPSPQKILRVEPSKTQISDCRRTLLDVEAKQPKRMANNLNEILWRTKERWAWFQHEKILGRLETFACKRLQSLLQRRMGLTAGKAKQRASAMVDEPSRAGAMRGWRSLYVDSETASAGLGEVPTRERERACPDGPQRRTSTADKPGTRTHRRSSYVRRRSRSAWTGAHEEAIKQLPRTRRELRRIIGGLGVPRGEYELAMACATIKRIQKRPHKTAHYLRRYRSRRDDASLRRLVRAIGQYAAQSSRGATLEDSDSGAARDCDTAAPHAAPG